MGDLAEAVIMISIVVLNAILGLGFRTERTIEALRNMSAKRQRLFVTGGNPYTC